MTDPLVEVRKAAKARKRADAAYRLALQVARDSGHAASTIGAAAGVSRQAVLQLTERKP